ncbi:proteophosphoglycan 5 [Ceratobasidium sp. AG-Ba]|nr:proteophosphoglycan 5 [Ceratobasidium sp. AG-Ba]
MHRFRVRTKSDASKRSEQTAVTAMPSPPAPPSPAPAPLLDLPPASDFRTSLILPDLSRRFTLLRGQNGEPLSIEDVRSRLAQQRANGHENHVTEEEEEIMIDALIRAHSIDPTASASDSDQGYVTANGNDSTFGSRYDSSELPSPVSASSNKRHSNNMFGSSRVRDQQNYIRSTTKSSASAGRAPRKTALSTASAPASSLRKRNDLPALEDPTDDDEGDQTDASASHAVPSPGQGSVTFDTYLSNSTFSPAQIRRASLALQDVIQEFEEGEEDEKILAPRSGPFNGGNQNELSQDHEPHAHHTEGPIGYGEAIAWPNDQSGLQDSTSSVPYSRSVTASPTQRMDAVNRLPGYVPGMHRPITPRDSAVDTDTTGRSSTQLASTPGHGYSSSSLSSPTPTERALPPNVIANKRGSITNSPLRTRPRQLSIEDQYGDTGGSSSDSTQTPLKSALSDRRRPMSPLADSVYASSARSATPSNTLADAWSPTAVSFSATSPSSRTMGITASALSRDGHLRQTSSASSGMEASDGHYSSPSANRANGTRVVSPSLPDSSTLNGSSGLANIVSSWNGATTNVIVDEPIHRTPTPSRVISTMEMGHSMMPPHPFRSPTPSRSPVRIVSGGTPSRTATPLSRSTTPNLHKRGHSRNGSLATDSVSGGRPLRTAHAHSPSTSSGLRQNPLMMSPMLNSSRSSLASTGSSYHSWDEDQLGGKPTHKRGVSVFIDNETSWKKLRSGFDTSMGMENAPDPDDIREVLAGLTKQDIAAVQEKLVFAAVKKRTSVRPLSGQKKRRASASQSVTSLPSPTATSPNEQEIPQSFHTTSPAPVIQTPPSPPSSPSTPAFVPLPSKNAAEHAMKTNALLHAMMDSIESSPAHSAPPPPPPQALTAQSSFSSEEQQSTPPTATPPSPTIEPSREVSDTEPLTPDTPIPGQDLRHKALTDALFGSDSDATVKDSRVGFGRSQSLRAFAMPPVDGLPSPKDEDNRLLAEEVERRAMAATAALKSPSTTRFADAGTNGRKAPKKLSTRQISSPQLIPAATSVDAIPNQTNEGHSIPTTVTPTIERAPQPSKLSQRIKKFTGNLRTKTPNPTGEEISPYVIESATPPASETPSQTRQMPSFDPPTPPKPTVVTISTAGDDSNSSSAPGTPTSTQPRLRGFMARLRKGRKDSTDSRDNTKVRAPSPLGPNAKAATNGQEAPVPPPPHIPAAMLRPEPIPPPDNFSSSSLGGSRAESPQNVPPPPPPPPPPAPTEAVAETSEDLQGPVQPHTPSQMDEEALRQLYNAASHLGLDRAVINDILVRSQSTSSRSTGLTHAQSPTTTTASDTPITPSAPTLPMSSLERALSVTTPKAPRNHAALGRQLSLKPFSTQPVRATSPAVTSQPPVNDDNTPKASVIRRTIIFPSQPGRSSSEVVRRPSTSRHKRSRSGSIHSNKSVQDRAPTPPPSRAPQNKRFSKDQSPPVPQLPSGLDGSVSAVLQPPGVPPRLGSGSNYDSLYEMYTENSGQQDSEITGESAPNGSAVEVLELSDGQVIWSVVDGLRSAGDDDDTDDGSPFPYRMSRNSEYSVPEPHELRFKEHQRTASKGSMHSISKAPKPQPNRPETRVFFSNAGDIGQLIDNLAKSAEAGQFNIIPGVPGVPSVPNSYLRPQSGAQSAHSFNSSFNSSMPDGDWTVEERLDHMIAASNRKRVGL